MTEGNGKQVRHIKRIIAEYKITAWDDGNVQITGPFQDFMLFRQIMNKAEMAAIHALHKASAQRIVEPSTELIKRL